MKEVKDKSSRRRKAISKNTASANSSLPRLFVSEHQEFVIEGQIFTWYFSNPELRQGIVLNRKGVIEPQIISVTEAKNLR